MNIRSISIRKNINLFTLYILLFSFCISCYKCPTEPKNPNYETTLSVHYEGPTFISLYFSISDSGKSREYAIKRDDEIVLTGNLKGKDTIITDWNTFPSSTYTYELLIKKHSKTIDKSETISATSMDTTSHNFTWEVDTIGENGTLFDVWAADGNNALAVGAYYKTWGGDHYLSTAWNGDTWIDSSFAYLWLEARFIHAFSENDIWSFPGRAVHYNGSDWILYTEENSNFPFTGNYIHDGWGTSSSNMFFVGENGEIIHFNGSSFSQINSPSETLLRHIDGCVDSQTGEVRAWAGGWESGITRGSLIEYRNNRWKTVFNENKPFYNEDDYFDLGALFIPNDKIAIFVIAGGSGTHVLFHNQQFMKDYYEPGSAGYVWDMHGNDVNDFFIVGDDNIRHYNGNSFQDFPDIAQGFRLRGVYQKGDYVFIAGSEFGSQRAIVIRGKRN